MAPRYSIIPGDFALDARADVAHFRVLNLLGRHTDDEGWCRLKQLAIAEAIGVTRETVNRKLRDLVEWGYVERHHEDATGRAIWYRVLMDRARKPPPPPVNDTPDEPDLFFGALPAGAPLGVSAAPEKAHVRGGSHVGYNQPETGAELHPTCDPYDHTRCDRTQSQHKRPFSNGVKDSPLPPHGGDSAGDDDGGKAAGKAGDAILARLRADGRHGAVVEALLAPVLAAKRLRGGEGKLDALRGIVASARDLATPLIERAARIVVEAEGTTTDPEKIAAAVAAVRKGGLMIPIRQGSAAWTAWLAHYRATAPKTASLMERYGSWQVPAPFPPHAAPCALGAGAPDERREVTP